jgi:hypothetical protein
MVWIHTLDESEAGDELAAVYGKINGTRPGPIPNVLLAQSLRPETLEGHFDFYRKLMYGSSTMGLKRLEMIGVVVSRANGCHY